MLKSYFLSSLPFSGEGHYLTPPPTMCQNCSYLLKCLHDLLCKMGVIVPPKRGGSEASRSEYTTTHKAFTRMSYTQ